jgi:hypothetical protein
MIWLKKYFIGMTGDVYTYVGLMIAYFTLDGSAKVVTGWLILIGLLIWVISFPIRESDDSD